MSPKALRWIGVAVCAWAAVAFVATGFYYKDAAAIVMAGVMAWGSVSFAWPMLTR